MKGAGQAKKDRCPGLERAPGGESIRVSRRNRGGSEPGPTSASVDSPAILEARLKLPNNRRALWGSPDAVERERRSRAAVHRPPSPRLRQARSLAEASAEAGAGPGSLQMRFFTAAWRRRSALPEIRQAHPVV